MVELVLRPLADAFMQVGVFVALLVAPFGWARFRWGDRLDATLLRHRRWAPFVAAAVTMPPGCGGAIMVMAVYARGAVSFGAAVAALVATMGDASWVLLAGDPALTLQLKVVMLGTGAATGYVVDALGIAPRRRCDDMRPLPPAPEGRVAPAGAERPLARGGPMATLVGEPASRLHDLGALPAVLWLLLGTGATVSLPVTFQLLQADHLYLGVGVTGTVIAIAAFVRGGSALADDDTRTAHPGSMSDVLRHGGHEVAFVTVWVAAAYLSFALLTHLTGFDGSQLPLFGMLGVLVGALVGLVPGCAIQIVFCGIFLAGGMPLPTLVANSISQDGDALIPLLALEHRSALVATALTTVPAIVVGTLFHLIA